MPDIPIILPAHPPYTEEVKLSVADTALKPPTASSKHIVVIGGGVSGLMSAWILLDGGHKVTILSDHWAWTKDFHKSRLTSQIAGALWEFPPGGCGVTEMTKPPLGWAQLEQYEEWALQSFEFYEMFMNHQERHKAEFGLSMAKLNSFFYKPMSKDPEVTSTNADEAKLAHITACTKSNPPRLSGGVQRHNEDIKGFMQGIGVGEHYQGLLKDGYTHNAPIINTDKAMVFLMELLRNKGAEMETVHLKKLEKKYLEDLGYEPDGVINATGLGAKDLVADEDVFPVRGAIKRMANSTFDKFHNLNEAYLVPSQVDPDNPKDHVKTVFLVPRSDEILIVGSIVQPHNDQLDLTANSPEVEIMWKRARDFLPTLDYAQPIPHYPLGEGLRPFTSKNVKVRAEERGSLKVVHNYGHGGSGWTLAVGCARTAVHLLETWLDEKNKKTPEDLNKDIYG